MKKTYIAPTSVVVTLQHRTALLIASERYNVHMDKEQSVDPEDTW